MTHTTKSYPIFTSCRLRVSFAFFCFFIFINSLYAVQGKDDSSHGLTVDERIYYQRRIELVRWNHRNWPKENLNPKPALDDVLSSSMIANKVDEYLRLSNALEMYWGIPVTAHELQAELDRMVRDTKDPETLSELFAALNNDPSVIAECLARPLLVDRMVHNRYAFDERFHGGLKAAAKQDLAVFGFSNMKLMSGVYSETLLVRNAKALAEKDAVNLNSAEWSDWIRTIRNQFSGTDHDIPLQQLSDLQENESSFFVTAVLEKNKGRIRIATVQWNKKNFEDWWSSTSSLTSPEIQTPFYSYNMVPLSPSCTNDTWTATTATNAPTVRYVHTAVWTGNEMVIWGGFAGGGVYLSTGGVYTPSTDSWTSTSTGNAPAMRGYHTAVWTGSSMIVWGGYRGGLYYNSGSLYNPSSNTWTSMTTTNAPGGRNYFTGVWSGGELIVWGGWNGTAVLNTGGRYNPSTDAWVSTSGTNAPGARGWHTATWTGSEMIIWGGWNYNASTYLNTGGRYNPVTNSWTSTSVTNAPSARNWPSAVWTGSEMIVWGGYDGSVAFNSGGRYNPFSDGWTATSTTSAPGTRYAHTAVWTGSEMVVWGGDNGAGTYVNDGGRYDPSLDSWTSTTVTDAPAVRGYNTAIWTGSRMIVWGGYNGASLNTGGLYCAAAPTCGNISFSPSSLPNGYKSTSYDQTISTSGGIPPVRIQVTSGTLPGGLSLLSGGRIYGTPGALGTFSFTVSATDNNGCGQAQGYTISIVCPTISITPSTLPGGHVQLSYNQTLTASDGTSPWTYTITNGSLPSGLTLSSGGVISGTPNAAGNFIFTATATDANACIGNQSYSIQMAHLYGLGCTSALCLQQYTLDAAGLPVISTNYRLNASMGQELATGCSSTPHYVLQSGFWGAYGSTLVPVVLTLTKSGVNPQLDWSGNNAPYSIYRASNCADTFNNYYAGTTAKTFTDTSPPPDNLICYDILATAPGNSPQQISPEPSGAVHTLKTFLQKVKNILSHESR